MTMRVNTACRRAVRCALLASTGIAALAPFSHGAQAQTVAEDTAVELTRRSDTAEVADVSLNVQESTSIIGFTRDVLAIGVDGDLGNDRITLTGAGDVRGLVEKDNSFAQLTGLAEIAALFADIDTTRADVFGVEGGFGANVLTLEGDLVVDARAETRQLELSLPSAGGSSEPVELSLASDLYATALGLTSSLGRSTATNSGALTVESTADFLRADFSMDGAGIDLQSLLRRSEALAIGLAGDRYPDTLTNELGGAITTTATSNISVTGISLQAAKVVDAEDASQASAISAAMAAGQGNDTLANKGSLTANASSSVSETDIAAAVKELSPPSSLLPDFEEKSFSLAVATGMDGGLGADSVTNEGSIGLDAFANFNQLGIEVTDGGVSSDAIVTIIDRFGAEESEEDLREGAIAEIVGLRGDERGEAGGGADTLNNIGSITGVATADSDVTSIDIGLPLSEVFDSKKIGGGSSKALTLAHQALSVFGVGLMDYSSDASAFADGVRGGAGNDDIDNGGAIDIAANAQSNTVGVSATAFDAGGDSDAPDEPLSINATVFNTAANAVSHSVGLAGGAEDDDIDNDGSVTSRADADAGSVEVGVAIAFEEKALQIETPVVFSQTKATAQADGIDAGDGFDAVENRGALDAIADATATSADVTVGLSLINTGGGVNAAIIDKGIIADAAATGIRDGYGSDTVDNTGTIDATATATAGSTSVGVDVIVNTASGLLVTTGLAKADQRAISRAFGVERIFDDLDADASFTSTGEIDATATAASTRNSVSVDLAYTNTGGSIAAPVIFAENRAEADAGALISFEADDTLFGLSDMSATANANATSTGVGVSGAVSQIGVGAGVSVLKSSTIADADATLLSFGTGADTVVNGAVLLADADAVGRANDVSIAAGGTSKGVAAGGALIESNTKVIAKAAVVNTGADDDIVINDGSMLPDQEGSPAGDIRADALADASSTGVGVGITAVVGAPQNPGIGVGLSAALSRAGVHGDADAVAVDLGAGADEFWNADAVDAVATGKARNESVNVALGGSMIGAAVSGAIADTSVDADANATSADGGAGDDLLSNSGVLVSDATADANTVGVAASGSVAAGFAAGAAALLTDTTADALALGMNGGAGADTVDNAGNIDIGADADAANASVAVNINVTPTGVSAGAAIVSARTRAESDAVGLAGDAEGLKEDDEPTLLASENDIVRNLGGEVKVTSRADASTVSVGVNGQYNGFGGVAIIADTIADSSAIGLFGGSGADELFNAASVVTTSNAFGSGPAVAVNPFGANIGDVNTEASAFSYGLDGGAGDDALSNLGTVTSAANSTVSGQLIQVSLIGAAIGDLSTKANATAAGLFGGDGADYLSTEGGVTANSSASVTGTSVAVNFVGASFADVTTQAMASAAGLSGGAGENTFSLAGNVNANSTANARSTNVAVTLAGAAFADEADAGTVAGANAYGYLGGEDSDGGAIGGVVSVVSNADARNDAAAANGAGASFANTSPEALAYGAVFGGAGGDDAATHTGQGAVTADADTIAGVTSVSLVGASSAKANPLARATARGLAGDAGADALANAGSLTTTADADADVARYRVTVAGASIGSISSASEASAAGMDGGDDGDTLKNAGSLNSTGRARLDSSGVDVTLAGANVDTASGNQVATASAAGMLGGAGADDMENHGSIVSNTVTTGSSRQVGVVVAGAGLVDAKSVLEARSVGLDGEDGDDAIESIGAVISVATAAGGATNTSVTLLGASKGDTSANSIATASIIEGGEGADEIYNYGAGVATATAAGVAHNVEVTAGGALLGAAESKTTARANGLGGGAGDDYVVNAAGLDLNATASGRVGRTSVAVAGSDGGASVESDILATAVGIAGGAGSDAASNSALIDIDLSSTTTASSTSRVIAGASKVNAGLYSTVNGIGMSGDEDDDVLVNNANGRIDIAATANIVATSSSFNIAGVSATNGLMRSRGLGAGMTGGSGDDALYNYGALFLDINGLASASGSNFTLAGSATSGGDVKGTTSIFGMDGGAGNDFLYNTGSMSVRSDARGAFGSGAYSLAGYSGSGGAVGATATTTGVFGGSGLDEIFVGGSLSNVADARLTVNSDVNVTFGASSSDRSPLGAEAYSRGVNGGADADLITTAGNIAVYSYAEIGMTNTKFAGVGSAGGANSATTRADTLGALGDSGNDVLRNEGAMLVRAESKTNGSGSAGAAIGTTNSAAEVVARANAVGLHGGSGDDTLINTGQITADVINSTRSINAVSSYAIFSNGQALSTSTNYGLGALFFDSAGNTVIVNDGEATINYFGDLGDFRGLARADSTANGVTAGVGTDARAESRAHSNVVLHGARLGTGSHSMINNGEINVISSAFSSARATANGSALISGNATAIARAYVNSNTVTGVESLQGALDFVNTGDLWVLNRPKAATAALPNATGLSGEDPDARATATIEMNNVHAYGVRTGSADDRIENSGSITVRSQPEADRALARATPGGAFSLSVDAFADAVVNVNDAEAYGIHAGDGDNVILNSGQISVVSDPYAEARAEATGRGPDGDVWLRATANALRAQAYGVVTGSGDDYINNSGLISVNATPGRSATTSYTVGEWCLIDTPAVVVGGVVIIPAVEICTSGEVDRNERSGSTSTTKIGVSTGSGNDTLVNSGTISVSGGVAISLGDGDDLLMLEPGASVIGSISAGAGDDTLHFVGAHSWNASGQGFENFIKSGAGLTSLSNPGTLSGRTQVFEGVLRIAGGVSMSDASQLTTSVFANGAVGQFASTGAIQANGALTVLANEGVYTDGALYTVVSGTGSPAIVILPPIPGISPGVIIPAVDGLQGGFDTIALPAPTALRSFTGAYTDHAYLVTANVDPISSLMSGSNATAASFASALDGATPFAQGGVEKTIATLQSLPDEQQVRGAVEAAAPDLAMGNLKMARASFDAGLSATQQRLQSFRAGKVARPAPASSGFSFSEGPKSMKGATAWMARFDGGSAAPGFANGFTGDVTGAARGVDVQTESGAMFGFSMTNLQGTGTLDSALSAASFNSTATTLYGAAPIGESGYATASMSWGQTGINGGDPLYGAKDNYAAYEKKGAAIGVNIEAGRRFPDLPGAPEMFAAVNYQDVTGAGFAIDRLQALSLEVDQARTSRLDSELGVRMISSMRVEGMDFRPHLALSWVSRNGAGESVAARFADMPDYRFRLASERENRDAFKTEAGFSLFSGPRYEVTASGVSELGAEKVEARGEFRAVVKF